MSDLLLPAHVREAKEEVELSGMHDRLAEMIGRMRKAMSGWTKEGDDPSKIWISLAEGEAIVEEYDELLRRHAAAIEVLKKNKDNLTYDPEDAPV